MPRQKDMTKMPFADFLVIRKVVISSESVILILKINRKLK
ncbi:MAG: hypothetical protein K0R77_3262 [Chryseobacterium sp.]|jgi:hypothetical protein|nr:hypothetical protein [Chryseobacterium sp.]